MVEARKLESWGYSQPQVQPAHRVTKVTAVTPHDMEASRFPWPQAPVLGPKYITLFLMPGKLGKPYKMPPFYGILNMSNYF